MIDQGLSAGEPALPPRRGPLQIGRSSSPIDLCSTFR